MMTEMTRYKQQTDFDEDDTSLGSTRTEELASGSTRIRYHMGFNYWRSRTKLEKLLMIGWVVFIVTIIIFIAIIHSHASRHQISSKSSHDISSSLCLTKECIVISGTVLQRMNFSVDPCDNFYQYSCGGWIASSVKPEGKPLWGTLNKIAYDNQEVIKKVLESNEQSVSEAEEKAKIFYRSCRDYNDTIEKRGAKPLISLIKEAGGWSLSNEWAPTNYNLQSDIIRSKFFYNSEALFSWAIMENDKKSDTYVLEFDQGGLLLAARDSYLNESEKAITEAYVEYITKVGVLLGAQENKSRAVAKDILAFETSLAEITTPDSKRIDTERLYHNMSLRDLTLKAPFIDWTEFVNAAFRTINRVLSPDQEIVVYAPEYLGNLTLLLRNMSMTTKGNTTIHNYLTWHIIKNYIGFLSKDFRKAYTILEKAQVGVSGWVEEWRECVDATDSAFGDAVGAMFVRNSFPQESKDMAAEMLTNIRTSFRKNLGSIKWMDAKTKYAALEKADSISQMIGYSESILNSNEVNKKYHDLYINENEFFESNINVTRFKVRENLKLLFKPVNKTRWDMTASTVNAYYSPTKNTIVFPAGILQPPFFDKNNPLALNYGAVGVVMGHELSHAFDNEGRKYDKNGNLHNWWEPITSAHFREKTKCMISQYSNYTLRDEHLRGLNTLGENIADNGGLKASFEAYKTILRNHVKEISLPGLKFSPEKLFFLGFSQVWCSLMTKEVAHLEIMKDSHVPPEFRVRGTLSNSRDFAEAFKCPLGSPMNPVTKCKVW